MPGNFSLHIKIILFFYRTTQFFSGLLNNFRIAMLPCYWGFSLSAWFTPILEKCQNMSRKRKCLKKFGPPPPFRHYQKLCKFVFWMASLIKGTRPVLGLLSPGSPPNPRPCPWARPRRSRGSRRRGNILVECREEQGEQ